MGVGKETRGEARNEEQYNGQQRLEEALDEAGRVIHKGRDTDAERLGDGVYDRIIYQGQIRPLAVPPIPMLPARASGTPGRPPRSGATLRLSRS